MNNVVNWFLRYRDIIPEFDYFMEIVFRQPLRAIRVNTIKVSPKAIYDVLLDLGFDVYKLPSLSYVLYSPNKGLGKTIFHQLGYYYLEDIVSILPPKILLYKIGRFPLVLDLAAAPGGKCTHMGQLLIDKHYFVLANDISKTRINILIKNIERLGLTNIIVTCYDSRKLPYVCSDRILFDAPCSSESLIYEMSEKDLRFLVSGKSIEKYPKLQMEIIKHAYNLLADGGYLLYSVCTFAPEECEAVVNYALQIGFKIEKISIPSTLFKCSRGIDEWVINGEHVKFDSDIKHSVRIYPHLNFDRYGGSIGYLYIVLLRK